MIGKDWIEHFKTIPKNDLMKMHSALSTIWSADPLMHKIWGYEEGLVTIQHFIETEIKRRNSIVKSAQRPIITGSFKSKRKSK